MRLDIDRQENRERERDEQTVRSKLKINEIAEGVLFFYLLIIIISNHSTSSHCLYPSQFDDNPHYRIVDEFIFDKKNELYINVRICLFSNRRDDLSEKNLDGYIYTHAELCGKLNNEGEREKEKCKLSGLSRSFLP